MTHDLRSFWSRYKNGLEVAVAHSAAEQLLGVRDGFRRYFHDGLDRQLPVVVVPQTAAEEEPSGLALSDEETIALARARAARVRDQLGDEYAFYVGTEGGLHSLEVDGAAHYFVRNWTVILGSVGEAWGASGSLEIPGRFIEGLADAEMPLAIPGKRRRGGMISSLTGGLETRRTAVASATLHALASLFYGILQSAPVRHR